MTNMLTLKDAMAKAADQVETELDRLLAVHEAPEEQLIAAMRHGSLNGGKRFRPFLLLESAKLFSVSPSAALRAAAAIELVHCYSLIHDDLPAMDDDDLRRGLPTVHKKFDDATAILAGDALLTLAFEVLSHPDTHPNARIRCDLVHALARASGGHGMVGGQMIDLRAEEQALDIHGITRLQRLKTGRLIEFSCRAGALLGNAPEKASEALRGYAQDLGLCFQIADDLLDVEGKAAETGKAVGKDAEAGKATFVSIMGVERARDQAHMLAEQAVDHLAIFDEKADFLRDVARFVVERRS